MRVLKTALRSAIATVLAASAAHAAEFCVVCEGPSARYACTFNDPAAHAGDARLKLLCITELAKAGPHASCAVDRTQAAHCEGGAVKALAVPDGMQLSEPPAAAAAPPSAPSGTAAHPQPVTPAAPVAPAQAQRPADPPKPDGPPKTVQEMVEKGNASTSKALTKTGESAVEAAKSTGSAIENAGKAVGNAAKKTWNCITSLFGDC